ncbi:LamG domain-containing protein [Arthrobacter oryzae]|uniref:Concanavalin A-like lectin/glucanase superfamily protein n=1 Tax=Arthrobacter oryzae TaxID=409290 RepID=A0A495EHT9_9MICC|nr:LamG domain-containing protein [Arthrobacter oryzae]RKR15557.1 hypothetical protein C8D78_3080 [Arthrobacter oryzae]
MRKLKALSTVGTLGMLVAGSLVFGSAQVATAASCSPAPTNSYPGTVVVATGFESGGLCGLIPTVSGTGTAAVSTAKPYAGTHSVKLHVTTDIGSVANLSSPAFTAGTKTSYAEGWFNITVAGVSGNDVPYFRFFSGSTRVADIYRYNSNGQLWLRVTAPNGTFVYTKLISSNITLSAWHHVIMRVTANGAASTVQVWFDGVQRYSSTSVNMLGSSLSKVQLGAEHDQQKGDEYIDHVVIKRS